MVLKSVVIFMFMNSIPLDNQLNVGRFSDYGINTDGMESRGKTRIKDRDKEEEEEEEETLDSGQLLEKALIPSNKNRTPEGTLWLFFNRIPRTGGKTIVSLLQSLSEDRDLQHKEHEYRTDWQRLLTEKEQKNLASWFEYIYWPTSYDRFSLYIDFEEHLSDYAPNEPAYITMTRDPVSKFISYFHYKRIELDISRMEMMTRERQKPGLGRKWYWRTIDECILEKDSECDFQEGKSDFLSTISFLCGQEEECLSYGNKGALQMAKYHAENDYSVVGLIEHLNTSLIVLEEYLPLFFRGAIQRYWSNDFKTKIENKNPKSYEQPSEEVLRILRDKLALEIELYDFLKQRLEKQFAQIDLESFYKEPVIKKEAIKALNPLDRFKIEMRYLEKNKDEYRRSNKSSDKETIKLSPDEQEHFADPDEKPVLDAYGNIPGYNVLIN